MHSSVSEQMKTWIRDYIRDHRSEGCISIHVVFTGFNEYFKATFSTDPQIVISELIQEGYLKGRPAKKGFSIWLPEDSGKGKSRKFNSKENSIYDADVTQSVIPAFDIKQIQPKNPAEQIGDDEMSKHQRFVGPKMALTAPIVFKRTLGTNGRNHSHTLSELTALEAVLDGHFRQIGLVGEFTLAFSERLNGSAHSHGLTVLGVRGNTIRISYQPGGNETRFVYALHLSAHLVSSVHEKLSAAVKAGLPKPVELSEPQLVTQEKYAGESVLVSATVADTLTLTVSSSREVSVEVGDDLSLVTFAECVPEVVLPTLRRDLEAELRKFPHEGIFTVKCSGSSSQFSGVGTFAWCNFQNGTRGIGFWHRVSVVSAWVKYALIADNDSDIKSFAEKLGKVPETKEVIADLRSLHRKKLVWKDYVGDVGVIDVFVNALAQWIQSGKHEVVPSGIMTEIFQKSIDPGMSPRVISTLTGEWVNDGYLGSRRASPKASYNVYFLRGKAAKLLSPEYHHLIVMSKFATPVVGEVIDQEPKGDDKLNVNNPSPESASVASKDAQLVQVAQLVQKLQAAAKKITVLDAQALADAEINTNLQSRIDSLEQELIELKTKGRGELLADLLAQADAITI